METYAVKRIDRSTSRRCQTMPPDLPEDLLEMLLRATDAWLSRLVCRKFLRCRAYERATFTSAVTSVERCDLAIRLGMPRNRAAPAAAAIGRLDVVQRHMRSAQRAHVLRAAAAAGNVDVIELVCVDGFLLTNHARMDAAAHGQLGVLEWARRKRYNLSDAITEAAARGQLGVLEWAHENNVAYNRRKVSYAAARTGGLAALQLAVSLLGCRLDLEHSNNAAARGDVAMLGWLRAHGCPWSAETLGRAAHMGRVDAVDWLWTHGCPRPTSIVECAARYARLDVLRWAVAIVERVFPTLWHHSISAEHTLDVLEWMRIGGVPIGRPWGYESAQVQAWFARHHATFEYA